MAEAFAEELAGRDGACAADSAMAAAAQRIRRTEDRRMEEVYRIADCGFRIAECGTRVPIGQITPDELSTARRTSLTTIRHSAIRIGRGTRVLSKLLVCRLVGPPGPEGYLSCKLMRLHHVKGLLNGDPEIQKSGPTSSKAQARHAACA